MKRLATLPIVLPVLFVAACAGGDETKIEVAQAGAAAEHVPPKAAPSPTEAQPGTALPTAVALPEWAREAAEKITMHASGKTRAWERLAELVDRFGPRLSGSEALEHAIDWAVEIMAADGLANARREAVKVPHWVRGEESLRVLEPRGRPLAILGLGMSVGTSRPLVAEVAVVEHVDEIAELPEGALAGKILLINQAMPPYDAATRDTHYGPTVQARTRGASEAAKKGASAVLVRSVTALSLSTPHTGTLVYEDDVREIPAAAVTVEGAEFLTRAVGRGQKVVVELSMGAKLLPEADSGNAIAELRGRELPDEVVVIGGHIDSWDVGDGAHDDGGGCLMAIEAAKLLHELGLVPRRTIRVVLFTNEENGTRGAKAYFEAHGHEKHAGAIEADSGSGAPSGFGVATEDEALLTELQRYAPLFEGLGASRIGRGFGGADIDPLRKAGVLAIGLEPDASHYFDVHHSHADTIEKIDPAHLEANAAAMALMAYVLAERH